MLRMNINQWISNIVMYDARSLLFKLLFIFIGIKGVFLCILFYFAERRAAIGGV